MTLFRFFMAASLEGTMGGWLVAFKIFKNGSETDNGWLLKPKAHRVEAYQKCINQLRTETDQKLTKKTNRAENIQT